MIWIKTQKGDLIECSEIKVKQLGTIQCIIINQNNFTLGEYNNEEEVKKIISRIQDIILYRETKFYEMPERKIPNVENSD